MNTPETSTIREIVTAPHQRPTVSIFLPFDPKMGQKAAIAQAVKLTVDKVRKELTEHYPTDTASIVLHRLTTMIDGLNYSTHMKSLAIYVSPLFEKVLYLDIPVEERIFIDDSFEIRDLVYAKKEVHKYLVLVLSFNECRIFLGDNDNFVKIVANPIRSIQPFVNDIPERIANFSDMSERKEVLMDKYIRHIDNNLDLVLNSYHLPLFVVGTKRISGHFRKLTKHGNRVLNYIHGNYEKAEAPELHQLLEPYVKDWRAVRVKDLLIHLDDAYGKNKLAAGIGNVWREAMSGKGRLLVVEKNFIYPAIDKDGVIKKAMPNLEHHGVSYIHDAVDKIIEQVLESGGDVEFVDPGTLERYDRIALLEYY